MSLLTSFLDSRAAGKENKAKQKLLDKGATISRDAFDKRMAEIGASDKRLLDLNQDQYRETSGNADRTFADLLANSREGFDEQNDLTRSTGDERLGIEKSAFDQQMDALGGLITAQRGAKMKMQEASEAERKRQQGFQDEADGLADALPEDIGFDAQTAGRAKAFTARDAMIDAATSAPSAAPAWAKGGPVASAFAAQDQRGTDIGQGDARAAARVSAYGDAYQDSERKMSGFADDIGMLTKEAAISRSALPQELGVGRLEGEQAKERADFATELSRSMADRRDSIASDKGEGLSRNSRNFHEGVGAAKSGYGEKIDQMLNDYFGTRTGAEAGFIGGVTDSSTNLENKLMNLNNFKMQNTRVTSPLSTTMKAIEKAVAQAMTMGASGG